jgi:DNA mismatch repair protein MutS
MASETPMQKQYNELKQQYKDTVLLFRVGDFYEAFHDDAVLISKVLGITLTGKGKGEERYPMAGIPYHALPNYLPKLVQANVKVAIADQTEEAVPGKLVERKVTQVITSGTIIDEKSLDSSKNNFIASIYLENSKDSIKYYLAFVDLTVGTLRSFETTNINILKNEINKISPSELICLDRQSSGVREIFEGNITELNETYFNQIQNTQLLYSQLEVKSLRGFGIEDENTEIVALGSLVKYLIDCQKKELSHIKTIEKYNYSDFMQLDSSTIRNLELLYPLNTDGDINATLFSILNECKTAMGKRKLRQSIVNPLTNYEILKDRIESVEFFYNNPILNDDTRVALDLVYDIERIAGRIGLQVVSPRDLLSLASSLDNTLRILHLIKTEGELPVRLRFLSNIDYKERLLEVIGIINQSISENAPVSIIDGGIFQEGYNTEVDELRNLKNNSKQILAEIQKREIANTGISSLKISYNKVFGYYIEITNIHKDKVPPAYIRKQTLSNAERFITEELKELETKILSSEEKLIKLENQLFIELRENISKYLVNILEISKNIAEVDMVSNLGFIARKNKYCKPIINGSSQSFIEIQNGRHPIVENLVDEFIPNSSTFSTDQIVHILTGPNMSGKSTYIRQVAIIALMAQIGSYVPADSYNASIIDRIFTRVGASDNLARGQSTFLVEMIETANILNNATNKSLVILDEVGRGTSTYDGVAIAWSIVDYIIKQIECLTLFATHYHELISLEKIHKKVINFNVEVSEDNKTNSIIFKHRIIEGGTNKSYGVHVAKLAGVPEEVVKEALNILNKFENSTEEKKVDKSSTSKNNGNGISRPKQIHPEQLDLL